MIVTLGSTITRIDHVKPGSLIFNTGQTVAYVDVDTANVIRAPNSSAFPVQPASSIPWVGREGILYGVDPTGGNPGVGVTTEAGLPFPAPVNSGPNLVIPELHSPNFVSGSSGWTIRKDGSAEFNNITIRNGTVISGVQLIYSSFPPTLGNLVASQSFNGGTDSAGNAYLPGVASYFVGATAEAVSLSAGSVIISTAATAAGPYSTIWTISRGPGANSILNFNPTGLIANAATNFGGGVNVNGAILQAFNGALVNNALTVTGGETADKLTVSNNVNMPLVSITDTLAGATGALLALQVAATGDNYFRARVAGDSNNRIGFDWISASGVNVPRFHMGDGTNSPNVNMYRAVLSNAFVSSQMIFDTGGGVQETDNAPTFVNSWSNAAGRATTFFRRLVTWDTMEWVGAVTVPTGFALGQNMTAATPVGYRPNSIQSLTAWDTSNNNPVRLAFTTGGVLQFIGPVANTAVGHALDIPAQRIRISV